MPLVGGFYLGSPISPALSFRCCSILASITLIGSQDLAVKSHPNLFTHSLCCISHLIHALHMAPLDSDMSECRSPISTWQLTYQPAVQPVGELLHRQEPVRDKARFHSFARPIRERRRLHPMNRRAVLEKLLQNGFIFSLLLEFRNISDATRNTPGARESEGDWQGIISPSCVRSWTDQLFLSGLPNLHSPHDWNFLPGLSRPRLFLLSTECSLKL
ncbi:hypothetical protein PR048_010972 [Dryococelus australis]|uniref:Uncharacterized protein n=1 Tax=Dryococelus australis TaxID=614101 RepID=A0ABQ9HK95_9NEOP|nr:hypothetical protein PR048_010972 [Dryococelus australis]